MFYDYHTHTNFSDDSSTPIDEMLKNAIYLGVSEIAITDHYDPEYPDTEFPFYLDFNRYYSELDRCKKQYEGKIKVVKGIELGVQKHLISECDRAAKDYDYDFIIASFHCCDNKELYKGLFFEGKKIEAAYQELYLSMYDSLKAFKTYCCVGHFNIADRYVSTVPDFKCYGEIAEEILKMIIYDGKGIEMNTSSFRYKMSHTTPSRELLQLYKDLGGEVLTIGSDAHRPQDIAFNFDFAVGYLKSFGFKYIATYDQMKPTFVKL